jgi:hypothetical protein
MYSVTAKLDATGHRWLAELSNFDFDIKYRCGKKNIDADFLSRPPSEATETLCTLQSQGIFEDTQEDGLGKDVVKAICEIATHEDDGFVEVTCMSQGVLMYQQELLDSCPDENKSDWRVLQEADPIIGDLKALVVLGEKPVRSQQQRLIEKYPCFRIYLREWDKLVLRDGVLFRRKTIANGQDVLQLILPASERTRALTGLHDDVGHLGRDRTMELVSGRFYWAGMAEDVKNKLKTCVPCIKR